MTSVVGLDLSLTSTGVCVIENGIVTELFHIPTAGKKGDTLIQRYARLDAIALQISDSIGDNDDLVVIEGPSYGSRGGSAHDRAGLWWMVVGECLAMGVPVAVCSPQGRAKYGVGKASAKEIVYEHSVARYQSILPHVVPDLSNGGGDEIDALLLADMGSRYLGHPLPVSPPDRALEALGGVSWPSV